MWTQTNPAECSSGVPGDKDLAYPMLFYNSSRVGDASTSARPGSEARLYLPAHER